MSLHITLNGDEGKAHVTSIEAAVLAYAGQDSIRPATEVAEAITKASASSAAETTGKGETAAQKKAREKKEAEAAAAATAEAAGPQVTVEEIRAVASEFNNDETRPFALEILAGAGAPSVSWFKDRPNAERVAVLEQLKAKLAEVQAAALA